MLEAYKNKSTNHREEDYDHRHASVNVKWEVLLKARRKEVHEPQLATRNQVSRAQVVGGGEML